MLNASKSLIDQDLDNLLLSSYSDVNALEKKLVILIDICFANTHQLQYAYNLALESVHVVYENECENLHILRNDFENNEDRTRVESST